MATRKSSRWSSNTGLGRLGGPSESLSRGPRSNPTQCLEHTALTSAGLSLGDSTMNTTVKVPFGHVFVLACGALGIRDENVAVCLTKYIPKEEALAVKDADDVIRLIVKAITLHVEAGLAHNRAAGKVVPLVDPEPHVSEIYAAIEADMAVQKAATKSRDPLIFMPGNDTLN
ncbi:hypothetical protein bb8_p10 [Bordetella phage vB_BbrP_BB8]|uniref:Uncharacterized protein n=1 Tax=Bordetella phage vB_BbrP_BB8 TaxID=2587820 RepID=A0A4Y5TNP7_9CAUD|nr:hypothetical protein bb8_p10 [Bordetella phage vB_BbrP_BB8]